jgi:hypothetical protein
MALGRLLRDAEFNADAGLEELALQEKTEAALVEGTPLMPKPSPGPL